MFFLSHKLAQRGEVPAGGGTTWPEAGGFIFSVLPLSCPKPLLVAEPQATPPPRAWVPLTPPHFSWVFLQGPGMAGPGDTLRVALFASGGRGGEGSRRAGSLPPRCGLGDAASPPSDAGGSTGWGQTSTARAPPLCLVVPAGLRAHRNRTVCCAGRGPGPQRLLERLPL